MQSQLATYWGHFDQFENATIAEVAESFIFGILVQSIEMRQAVLRIQTYDDNDDIAGIVKEMVTFLRMIILFDNVYLDASE